MDWFKKHVDTVIVMGGIVTSILWMNHKFTQVDEKFAKVDLRFAAIDLKFAAIDLKFAEVEKNLAVMKAVLMIKGQFPKELMAAREEK